MVESYNANDGCKAGDGRHCIASGVQTFARRQTRRHGFLGLSGAVITGEGKVVSCLSTLAVEVFQTITLCCCTYNLVDSRVSTFTLPHSCTPNLKRYNIRLEI